MFIYIVISVVQQGWMERSSDNYILIELFLLYPNDEVLNVLYILNFTKFNKYTKLRSKIVIGDEDLNVFFCLAALLEFLYFENINL